jgi:hypothetical protein
MFWSVEFEDELPPAFTSMDDLSYERVGKPLRAAERLEPRR